MTDIIYEPEEVWSLFLAMKGNLGIKHLLAYDDTGVEVNMVPALCRDFGDEEVLPYIVVSQFDEPEVEEVCINKQDCTKTAEELYEYLDRENDIIEEEIEEKEGDYLQKTIDDHELELVDIFDDFLRTIVVEDKDFELYCDDKTVKDLLDRTLAMISKQGIPVYRPAMLEKDDGTSVYVEYPYRFLSEE